MTTTRPSGQNLRGASLRHVRDLVRGRVEEDVSYGQAVHMLLESGHPSTVRDLSELIEKADAPPAHRQVAAHALARVGSIEAVDALLRATKVDNPRVGARVFNALGRVGDTRAFKAIEKARSQGTAEQADFALALLGARHGRSGYALAEPEENELQKLPRGSERPVMFERADAEDLDTALFGLTEGSLRVDLDDETGNRLLCGRERWTILLNRDIRRADRFERAQKRPMLGAVLAKYNTSSETYVHALWMITQPGEKGEVSLHFRRPSGSPFFFGRLQIRKEVARFRVRSYKRPGVFGVDIEGVFDNRTGLRFTKARSAIAVPTKRTPEPGRSAAEDKASAV